MSPRVLFLTIAWGIFCACSWTWCIGMYLPRIMLDRYGPAGFLVFAIPNVIGCAGFGYALRHRAHSEALQTVHRPMMLAFSAVVIAFHLFFVTLLFDRGLFTLAGPMPAALGTAGLLLAGAILLAFLPDRLWLPFALFVYAFSLVTFGATGIDVTFASTPAATRTLPWLAPVVIIGFLLCPYLDLTFHRAFTTSPSRHAFAVFGLTFAVMIVLTCAIFGVDDPPNGFILGHLFGQAIFTCGAHGREIVAHTKRAGPRTALFALPILAALVLPAARMLGVEAPADDFYLRFLVFYGLVFPAYVLVCMGPWRPAAMSQRTMVLLGAVILLLMPVYEIGFVHDRAVWLVIPTALLVVWAVARRRKWGNGVMG